MQLSPRIRLLAVLFALVGVVFYGLLVEFAVNAGRVHRGVSVHSFDIGGLNHTEARAALEERGEAMKVAPMIFTTEGFDCRFAPEDVGWGPQPRDTAQAAMDVGRDGSVGEVLSERWRSWTQGVKVEWGGSADPNLVDLELDRCEKLAESLGVDINRPRLRYKIKRAIVAWPREPFTIPLEG